MKKIFSITLILPLALSIVTCSKSNSVNSGNSTSTVSSPASNSGSNNSVINAADEAWVNNTNKMAYIFLADGKYKSYTLSNTWVSNGDGTYKVEGTSLTFDKTAYPFTVDSNTLTLTISGTAYSYTKTKPFTPGAASSAQLDGKLVLADGQVWVQEDITLSGYIFMTDGTYTYYWGNNFSVSSQGTWSTSGNTLTIIAKDIDPQNYSYSISGTTLTITNRFGDANAYDKRTKP